MHKQQCDNTIEWKPTAICTLEKNAKICGEQTWTSVRKGCRPATRWPPNASTFLVDISADVGTAFGRTTPRRSPRPPPVRCRRGGAASTRTSARAGRAVIGARPAPSAAIRSAPTTVSVQAMTADAINLPVSHAHWHPLPVAMSWYFRLVRSSVTRGKRGRTTPGDIIHGVTP